ncbi:MAG: rhomboid family intramembrane serine protease [Alphaproteobacteria bacterium]|nr:rhomboid family intramembrane serine protease [Alphaproteobacteria bacterium]
MSEPVQEHERATPPGGNVRQPAINAPKVVLVLFVLMVAARGAQSLVTREGESWVLLNFALIPARYDSSLGLIYPGGWGADIWVFVSHMFLHGDWLHLAINGFFMLAFGSVLARRLGTTKFLLFSLLSGLAAASVHLWAYWGDQAPLIGASGAISGQMAGTVRLMFARRRSVFDAHRDGAGQMEALSLREVFTNPRALMFLGIWVGITVLAGAGGVMAPAGSSIAWEAHLGGFAAGILSFGLFDRSSGNQNALV